MVVMVVFIYPQYHAEDAGKISGKLMFRPVRRIDHTDDKKYGGSGVHNSQPELRFRFTESHHQLTCRH